MQEELLGAALKKAGPMEPLRCIDAPSRLWMGWRWRPMDEAVGTATTGSTPLVLVWLETVLSASVAVPGRGTTVNSDFTGDPSSASLRVEVGTGR